MARLLFIGSFAIDDPTRASFAFTDANGAKEAGHEPRIHLRGDAVLLLKDIIAKNTVPAGWPSVHELLATSVSHNIPITV
jgi:predicted peroxiredoxin